MRADLCAAMLHEPTLLFLDEPTIGLDVVAKEKIRQFIKHVNQDRNTTIILTTHDLSDVEKLCERVIIIDQGTKIYDGKLGDLVKRFDDTKVVTVTYADDYPDVWVQGVTDIVKNGMRVTYTFPGKTMSTSDLIQQLMGKFQVVDLEINPTELEAVIRKIYERKLLDLV